MKCLRCAFSIFCCHRRSINPELLSLGSMESVMGKGTTAKIGIKKKPADDFFLPEEKQTELYYFKS